MTNIFTVIVQILRRIIHRDRGKEQIISDYRKFISDLFESNTLSRKVSVKRTRYRNAKELLNRSKMWDNRKAKNRTKERNRRKHNAMIRARNRL